MRSQHPAQLVTQRLVPTAATALQGGVVEARWSNAYTSMFLAGGNASIGNTFEMDGELLRSAIGARVGLGSGWEIDFEIPVAHASGGFLDDFVIDWHDLFGLPSQGRPDAARDAFVVEARNNGRTAFAMEPHGLEWMDVPIELAWRVLDRTEDRPIAVKVRAGVELPVGDGDRGFGNDELDVAFGLTAAYWPCSNVTLTAHVEHTFVGQPNRAQAAGLEFRDVTSAGVAAALPLWWEGWSFVGQVDWETSTLRSLGFSRVADDQLNIWLGVRVDLAEQTDLEVAFGEDLGEFIAPDFTAWLTLHHTFSSAQE